MTGPGIGPSLDVDNPVRHEFVPHNPAWFMPRCKVCREFEDHDLHRTRDDRPQDRAEWCDRCQETHSQIDGHRLGGPVDNSTP